MERFWQFVNGEDSWTELPPALRERLCASAQTLFLDLGLMEQYLPDDQALAAIAVPVLLAVGEDSHGPITEIAQRLGARLGTDVTATPGGHCAYHDCPQELAETIRPFLREIGSS